MTKRWLLCATTAAVLIATPALAANDAAQDGGPAKGGAVQNGGAAKSGSGAQQAIDKALKDRNTPDAAAGGTPDRSADSERPGSERVLAEQRLRRALTQAGFTDVQVLGATYRIRARDEDGNTVVLRVNPRAMDRHAMNKEDRVGDENARDDRDQPGMADEDMDRGGIDRGGIDHAGMDGGGMNREAMRGETSGEGGKAYGAGPMASRGEGGRWAGNGQAAFDRAYDQGFRDGYSRAFNRAQGWR